MNNNNKANIQKEMDNDHITLLDDTQSNEKTYIDNKNDNMNNNNDKNDNINNNNNKNDNVNNSNNNNKSDNINNISTRNANNSSNGDAHDSSNHCIELNDSERERRIRLRNRFASVKNTNKQTTFSRVTEMRPTISNASSYPVLKIKNVHTKEPPSAPNVLPKQAARTLPSKKNPRLKSRAIIYKSKPKEPEPKRSVTKRIRSLNSRGDDFVERKNAKEEDDSVLCAKQNMLVQKYASFFKDPKEWRIRMINVLNNQVNKGWYAKSVYNDLKRPGNKSIVEYAGDRVKKMCSHLADDYLLELISYVPHINELMWFCKLSPRIAQMTIGLEFWCHKTKMDVEAAVQNNAGFEKDDMWKQRYEEFFSHTKLYVSQHTNELISTHRAHTKNKYIPSHTEKYRILFALSIPNKTWWRDVHRTNVINYKWKNMYWLLYADCIFAEIIALVHGSKRRFEAVPYFPTWIPKVLKWEEFCSELSKYAKTEIPLLDDFLKNMLTIKMEENVAKDYKIKNEKELFAILCKAFIIYIESKYKAARFVLPQCYF